MVFALIVLHGFQVINNGATTVGNGLSISTGKMQFNGKLGVTGDSQVTLGDLSVTGAVSISTASNIAVLDISNSANLISVVADFTSTNNIVQFTEGTNVLYSVSACTCLVASLQGFAKLCTI